MDNFLRMSLSLKILSQMKTIDSPIIIILAVDMNLWFYEYLNIY